MLFAELTQNRDVRYGSLPYDLAAHASVVMRHKITHGLDRPLLNLLRCLKPIFSGEFSTQLSDLLNAEGHGALVIRVAVKGFKGFSVALDRLADFKAVIADMG